MELEIDDVANKIRLAYYGKKAEAMPGYETLEPHAKDRWRRAAIAAFDVFIPGTVRSDSHDPAMDKITKIKPHGHGTIVIFRDGTRVCSCSPVPVFHIGSVPNLRD